MNRPRLLLWTTLVVLAPAFAAAQLVGVRAVALARVSRARQMAADPALLKAVQAQNAAGDSLDEVKRKDREWTGNTASPLRKRLTTSECAQRLRLLTQDDPLIVEVILMDAQGANVCVSRETTDYWQGDEAKFLKTVVEGRDVFLDEPALDASTSTYAIQLSAVVLDGRNRVGALTFSMRVRDQDIPGPGAGR